MHPNQLNQINNSYKAGAIEVAKTQLDAALAALEEAGGSSATHWVSRINELVGRIRIAELGASIFDARKLLDKSLTFNHGFRDKTDDYLNSRIDLATYKAWLMPQSHQYLNLHIDHPVYTVKWALAEYSKENLVPETRLKEEIQKIMTSEAAVELY